MCALRLKQPGPHIKDESNLFKRDLRNSDDISKQFKNIKLSESLNSTNKIAP
jgi:hypothetical protein